MTSPYLTLAEVAERLRRKPKAARRWLRNMGVPLLHLGRAAVLVDRDALLAAEQRATHLDPPRMVFGAAAMAVRRRA